MIDMLRGFFPGVTDWEQRTPGRWQGWDGVSNGWRFVATNGTALAASLVAEEHVADQQATDEAWRKLQSQLEPLQSGPFPPDVDL